MTACPNGWHLPINDEMQELINYLGGNKYTGGEIKESGTIHWLSTNPGATNSSGFSALPCGIRYSPSSFVMKDETAFF